MEGLNILYLPWEGISSFLRTLSLSGGAGNAAAFFLYVCISLLPVLAAGIWKVRKKKKVTGADLWLLVLSAYTFYLLYAFINPALLVNRLPRGLAGKEALIFMKAVYGGLWLTVLLTWILFAIMKELNREEVLDRKEYLYRGADILLKLSMLLILAAALYREGTVLAGNLRQLAGNGGRTSADYVFAVLKIVVSLVPTGFLLGILNQICRLLHAMRTASFEEKTVEEARRLAGLGSLTVKVSFLCSLVWNGALFLGMGALTSLNYHWEISVFPMVTAFAALILARYLKEAGELRRENDMFI